MSKFGVGELVVLKSGSMRMCVEYIGEDDAVHAVWCNDGVIGRDSFNPALLNKWEHREDHGGQRGGDRERGGGRSHGGNREGGGRFHDAGRDRSRDHDDRPPRKTGWDGKPRKRTFFRKDD